MFQTIPNKTDFNKIRHKLLLEYFLFMIYIFYYTEIMACYLYQPFLKSWENFASTKISSFNDLQVRGYPYFPMYNVLFLPKYLREK